MLKNYAKQIFLLSMLVISTSCSSLHFKSNGLIIVEIGHHENIDTLFEVSGQRDFYLWGLYPANYDILIDEELAHLGAAHASILKVGLDDKKYWTSMLYQIITFGMYQPVYYSIIAKGKKTHE